MTGFEPMWLAIIGLLVQRVNHSAMPPLSDPLCIISGSVKRHYRNPLKDMTIISQTQKFISILNSLWKRIFFTNRIKMFYIEGLIHLNLVFQIKLETWTGFSIFFYIHHRMNWLIWKFCTGLFKLKKSTGNPWSQSISYLNI
jgi:hypothetical protein